MRTGSCDNTNILDLRILIETCPGQLVSRKMGRQTQKTPREGGKKARRRNDSEKNHHTWSEISRLTLRMGTSEGQKQSVFHDLREAANSIKVTGKKRNGGEMEAAGVRV